LARQDENTPATPFGTTTMFSSGVRRRDELALGELRDGDHAVAARTTRGTEKAL
jgi:hypothetical protein